MVEACPPATGDITLNLRNRGKAIDKANYGPMDPNQPNGRYWEQKAQAWDVTPGGSQDAAVRKLCSV